MKNKLFFLLILLQVFVLKGEEGSVVCLHGFFRSYKCMIPIGNALRDEGLRVYLWEYPGRKKTIERHAACLVEVLNEIAQQHPGQPIHFVTHSLGGIILRATLSHPDCPNEAKIGRAVLLAPPNKGAALARNFKGSTAVQCLFGSHAGDQLLNYTEEDMCKLGSFPPSMDVMVLAGNKESPFFKTWIKEPNDGKVTVEETKLPTPHDHRTLFVSHSWIMTSRESISIIREFLLKHSNTTSETGLQPGAPALWAPEGGSQLNTSVPVRCSH
jgi:pimeloyl-ACP methyl ester carboxylesterase